MPIKIKKYKKASDYSYTLGAFTTLTLLKFAPQHILTVYIKSNSDTNIGVTKIKKLCKQLNIKYEINDKIINRLSSKGNVFAIGIFEKFKSQLDQKENHIVLINPSDAGNLGTIIRTMLGFGINNIVIIDPAVDIFKPSVIRSSMGAIFKINFEHFESFEKYRNKYKNHLYLFYTDGENLLTEMNFKKPFTLVFGNEGAGLPDNLKKYGTTVTIPQSKNIDSLNLAVSVGVGLYESSKD